MFSLANITYELGIFSFEFYSFTQQCLNVWISFSLTGVKSYLFTRKVKLTFSVEIENTISLASYKQK